MTATLGEVMTKPVVVAPVTANVETVRRLMLQRGVSRVVIVSESKASLPVGIITAKDIIWYSITEEAQDLSNVIAHKVMSRLLVKGPQTMTIRECARRMLDGASSSVTAVNGDLLSGIATKTDLCSYYARTAASTEKVAGWMSVNLIVASTSHKITYAASLMAKNRISRLPVVEDKLEGILTVSDMLSVSPVLAPAVFMPNPRMLSVRGRLVTPREVARITVGEVMTPRPVTTTDGALLKDAARTMVDHKFSGLPVLDEGGALVGLVTKTDVVRAIAGRR